MGPTESSFFFFCVLLPQFELQGLQIRFKMIYPELKELGEMFNIEGLVEDPQRSSCQFVFIDRMINFT
ncbi:hypothetical protein HanLR1_Chr09g0307621 [Helianthus annuus]|nr:hypothetical protein HanHA89_Chr09g0328141 [Helianthus annuus]KAJ0706488.1 hypothetical protein HanLR1_Chr09g0307621 [Helianthus annuus]